MRSFNDIKIYNKIFDDHVFENILEYVKKSEWHLQFSTSKSKKFFWRLDLDQYEFITKTCFDYVKRCIGDNFVISSVYLNGQSTLQSGEPHVDADDYCNYTFLVYMNPSWRPIFGGHTIFLNKYLDIETKTEKHFDSQSSTETRSILPKPNMGLFFPSNIYHFAEGPTTSYNSLRVTLAYKLSKI
jgi:hypothetical protein